MGTLAAIAGLILITIGWDAQLIVLLALGLLLVVSGLHSMVLSLTAIFLQLLQSGQEP